MKISNQPTLIATFRSNDPPQRDVASTNSTSVDVDHPSTGKLSRRASEPQEHELNLLGSASDEDEPTRAVKLPNLLEEFEQATDEMSAALAQFRSRRDYDKKSGSVADSFERVLEEEAFPKAEKIVAIARLKQIPIEELLRNARQLFPDDSDLIMVLRELLRLKGLDEIIKRKLSELMRQVVSQADQKRLKAGIHCSLKAKLFGKKLRVSAILLRESYRQFLASEDSGAVTYEDWVTLYGHEKRALVLSFVESSLVADMGALDPSCSKLEFGGLLNRIGVLKVLRSADALFIRQMTTDTLVSQFNNREADWLAFLLSMLQFPDPVSLGDAILELFGAEVVFHNHGSYSKLLQALQRAVSTLPVSLFPSHDERDALLEELLRMADVSYQQEQHTQRRSR